MCNLNLKEVNSIKKFHDGGKKVPFTNIEIPFTRTWTLEGYDENNKLIVSVSEGEKHNYLKFAEFIKQLKLRGYKLTNGQRDTIKEYPFLDPKFIPYAKMSDLIEIANRVDLNTCDGYSKIKVTESYIYQLKTFDENVKKCVAEQLGLGHKELENILSKI